MNDELERSGSGRNEERDDEEKEDRQPEDAMEQDPSKREGMKTKPQRVVRLARILISCMMTKLEQKRCQRRLSQRKMILSRWNLPQPL